MALAVFAGYVYVATNAGALARVAKKGGTVEPLATITGAIDNQWTRARPVAGREGRGMTLATSSGIGGGRIVVRSFKGTVQLRGTK